MLNHETVAITAPRTWVEQTSPRSDEDTREAPCSIVIFGGDIAIFRSWLIRDLVAARWRVIACGPEDASQAQAVSRLGAEYVSVATDRTGLSPTRDLASIVSLSRVLRRMAPDVFLSFHTKYNFVGPLAARRAGVPRIFALVAGLGYAFSPGNELKRRLLRAGVSGALRLSLRCCNGVFVQNKDDLALVRSAGWAGPRTQVIKLAGTGVDLDEFPYVAPQGGPLRVLLIARLLREKGIADFVAAARLVKQRHPDCSFSILGPFETNPGALRPQQLEAWQQEGVVSYLGRARDVRPQLQKCNLFVLPSYYREGIPKTILEAMATGRAIITTDTPGCRETVVEGVNGFLIPPRDPQALATAIERCVLDPHLVASMGHESRRLAGDYFDVRTVNRIMINALTTLANKAG